MNVNDGDSENICELLIMVVMEVHGGGGGGVNKGRSEGG